VPSQGQVYNTQKDTIAPEKEKSLIAGLPVGIPISKKQTTVKGQRYWQIKP
jgi:hypothetical protein